MSGNKIKKTKMVIVMLGKGDQSTVSKMFSKTVLKNCFENCLLIFCRIKVYLKYF